MTHTLQAADVQALRAHFPALTQGAAHFDGPGGSQTPTAVADAVHRTLTAAIANRGLVTEAERFADEVTLAARAAMADFVGGDPRGIVFGRSMTQLTFDFARTLAKDWRPGDEIVVSRLDHDSNIRPWVIAAESAGAAVRWIDFDPKSGEVTLDAVEGVLSERTRLVAITAASNLIGTRPPVAEISRLAHARGALVYVDGVHYSAHVPVDMAALGADFYACSPYKFLGPHLGVVAAAPETLESLRPDKLLPATDVVPERFELGTLPYELLAGTTAAVDFLAGVLPGTGSRRERLLASMAAVERYEDGLRESVETELDGMPRVISHSRAASRTPTLLLTFEGHPATAVRDFLADRKINTTVSNYYAIEASRWMGLGDEGGLRVGLAPYNDRNDVDRLTTALRDFFSR
ncbi:cysteine desulfurase-like protein [Nonomuraea sp. NPDC050153]|uniref:cysteine desulfurase-like protein n=1 Tax=Nonomuraea sp. NPDC050153 TaxID=3364359 RepID=UPI00378EA383